MNYTMEKNFNTSGRTVRLPYMDVAKGMGIRCVIIGHMGNETMECFSVAGEKSLTILCLHLIELNTMPWERILWQFNVTKHLFIPVVLLKIMWSVGGTFLIEKYKVIYKEIANERTKHKEKFRI